MSQATQRSYKHLLGQLNLEDIYIQQTFEYYFQRYGEREDMQYFVQHSARIPDALRDHKFIGVCDRTLGTKIPKTKTLAGGAMRGMLQTVGLIHSTGSERFRGCVVFPSVDDLGNVISAVGYRFCHRLRHWHSPVIHWQKPELGAHVQDGWSFVKEVIYGKTHH
ncbi:hypothetical protein [Rheinheimera texasensis]|uniref:hypothetical protein n=1 Tax=Rheinheimera texasensis TaxID=306205 RepID=UPI0032B15DB4